jgi:hypothetical protein
MTEVGGTAAYYLDRRPSEEEKNKQWARNSALILNKVIELNPIELQNSITLSIKNSKRFNTENVLNQIETIYKEISKNSN